MRKSTAYLVALGVASALSIACLFYHQKWIYTGSLTQLAPKELDTTDRIHRLDPSMLPQIAYQIELPISLRLERNEYMPLKISETLYARVSGLIASAPESIARRIPAATAAVGVEIRTHLRILVGVVTDSRPQTLNRAWRNVMAVSQMGALSCNLSFAYIVYDGELEVWDRLKLRASGLSIGFEIMKGIGADIFSGFIGKLAHQAKLIPLLAGFDVLWTVDSDIAFVEFNLHRFLETWLFAFETGPPLVSQPVSLSSTQGDYTVNAATWDAFGLLGELEARAVRVSFVEIQMPFIDVGFFLWMLQSLVQLMRPYLGLATDWGIDRLWCKMAQRYASEFLREPNRTACAVIIEPMPHENSRTIKKSSSFRKRSAEFIRLLSDSEQLRAFYVDSYDMKWLPLSELSWCRSKKKANTSRGSSYKQCDPMTKRLNCKKLRDRHKFIVKRCFRESEFLLHRTVSDSKTNAGLH